MHPPRRDLATGSQLCQYKTNASSHNCITLLGDQYLVAAQTGKGPLLFWAWHADAPLQRAFAAGPITCVAASPCGTYLAAGSASGAVWVWDVPSGRLMATWEAHFKATAALAWSASAAFLVSGGEDTQVCVAMMSDLLDVRRTPQQPYQALHTWYVDACSHTYVLVALLHDSRRSAHTMPVTALAVGAGDVDALVCSTSRDGHVKLWSLAQGTQLASFALPGPALCLALTPCEQRVYAGGGGGDVYEARVGKFPVTPSLICAHHQVALHASSSPVTCLQGHTSAVTCLAITGDGASVIAGAEDGSARVFEAASRQVVRVFDNPAKGALTGVLVTARRPSMVPGARWTCTHVAASHHGTGSVRKGPTRPQPLASLCKYEGMAGVLGAHEDAVVLLAGGETLRDVGLSEEPARDASGAAREVEALQQRLQRALQAGNEWRGVASRLLASSADMN